MKIRLRTDTNRKIIFPMDEINAYLSKWKPGTAIEIEITRHNLPREPIRRYYFGVVLRAFADYLGYDAGDETKEFHRQLKIIYFNVEKDRFGMYRDVPAVFRDESRLPMSEKVNFLEWVVRQAAREGAPVERR